MDIWYTLMTPFSWLLKTLYNLFNSYGAAIIFFSLLIKILLFPFSLKGKRGMIQTNMLQGEVNRIQKQYAKNPELFNQKVQELYVKAGVNPMSGCLWSFIPLFILFPIYAVVRRPMKYWLGLTEPIIASVQEAVASTGFSFKTGYPEIETTSAFFKDSALLDTIRTAVPEAGEKIYGVNFDFLGIDLSAVPTLKFWENGLNWASVGLFLIPLLVVVTTLVSSKIMAQTNQAAGGSDSTNAQVAQTTRIMQWFSPLMMAYFSFVMPAAMGLYIMVNSIFSAVQELIAGKLLKDDYEKAAEAARQRELEEKEREKQRRREKAERLARMAEETKKKKKAEQSGDKRSAEQREASRVGMRQYARGRAYDPNRYGGVTPYFMVDQQERKDGTSTEAPERISSAAEPESAPAGKKGESRDE